MVKTADAVVVGGGIQGVSVAYQLAGRGLRPLVVEQGYLASGSTGRCAAGVRQQWGTEMNVRLARASVKMFEVLEDELGYGRGIEFKQRGYLMLAYHERQWGQFMRNVELQRSLGVPVEVLTPGEAREVVPYLDLEGVVGATFCPEDGHINPFRAVDAYAQAVRRLGGEIWTYTRVTGIEVAGGRVVGVKTTRGGVSAAVVVNTAGPWSDEVAEMAGLDIPTYAQRHQILVTEPLGPMQGPMVISFYHGLYCQQTPHGSFIMGLGDPHEPRNRDCGATWQFLEEMAAVIVKMLPPLAELRVVRQWAGSYDMTPDAQPILGAAPEVEGYYYSVGFSGHGFMLAPMTGKLLAQLIAGEEPDMPVGPLGPDRFARGELILEPAVV
ncbi:MAG: FAD-binding oxidoreductase [Bacillota bacterium]